MNNKYWLLAAAIAAVACAGVIAVVSESSAYTETTVGYSPEPGTIKYSGYATSTYEISSGVGGVCVNYDDITGWTDLGSHAIYGLHSTQNAQLELDSRTLTIPAGERVYIYSKAPTSTNSFTVVYGSSSYATSSFAFGSEYEPTITVQTGDWASDLIEPAYSGTYATYGPGVLFYSSTQAISIFLDSSVNLIKFDSNTMTVNGTSYPKVATEAYFAQISNISIVHYNVAAKSGSTSAAVDSFEEGKTSYTITPSAKSYRCQIIGGDVDQWAISTFPGVTAATSTVTAKWNGSGSSAVLIWLYSVGYESYSSVFTIFASDSDVYSTATQVVSGRQLSYNLTFSETVTVGPTIALNSTASSWASVSGSTLSGTAPESATYGAILVAWSSNPTQFAYQAFNIDVEPAISLSYGSSSILAITGTAFERTPTTGASGLAINYTISGNPTGVSIDSSTGVLSGSDDPAVAVGTYTLVITATSVTNSANASTVSIKLTVDPVMWSLKYSESTFSILAGASISATTATNVSRVTYSADWGGISGLSINSSNGAISGKPDKSGTVTVTVSKAGYAVGAHTQTRGQYTTLEVYVQDALTASASASTLYLVTGKAIPFNDSSTLALSASASDGAAITWAIKSAGSTGLTVTSAGAVGGTAGAVNTSGSSVTFVCTSALNGLTQTKEVSVKIVIKPVLAFTSDPANAVIS